MDNSTLFTMAVVAMVFQAIVAVALSVEWIRKRGFRRRQRPPVEQPLEARQRDQSEGAE